jgi:hypothetical protein
MQVEFEPIEEFEKELRQTFERRPAPPSLKRRLMERRRVNDPRRNAFPWQRIAAALVLTAMLGGGVAWYQQEEQRKGEAARQQVLTALRITNHALDHMNTQLAAHRHAHNQGESR